MNNEIILTFDFERPPAAEDLGDVFTAMSRDYSDFSRGRTLSVTRVETGSITITLTDAVLAFGPYAAIAAETVAAINTIAEFAENLRKWFGRAKTDEGRKRLYKKGRKTAGQRAVEAIINTAAKTGSRVKIKYTNANGEILKAEITPSEALEMRKAATSHAAFKKMNSPTSNALSASPEVNAVVERLRLARSQDLTQAQTEAFVDVIVSMLPLEAADVILSNIASELESHGLFDLATVVRKHIRGPGGTLLPPTTTS